MSNSSPSPDASRLRFRKLRIAFSVTCGMLCLLLIALWVRSYWWVDAVRLWDGAVVVSVAGAIGIDSKDINWEPLPFSFPTDKYIAGTSWPSRIWGTFRGTVTPTFKYFLVPYWFATLLAAALTIVSSGIYRKRQFSLRTLLIATTLVAALLGLVMWAAKS